ncbi:hypothetical protein D9M72_595670 [compost metagenome]
MTLTMCVTTGTGDAKKRAFCGVTAAPDDSSASRSAPKITGMRLSRISPAGTGQRSRGRRTDVAAEVMVSVDMAGPFAG